MQLEPGRRVCRLTSQGQLHGDAEEPHATLEQDSVRLNCCTAVLQGR